MFFCDQAERSRALSKDGPQGRAAVDELSGPPTSPSLPPLALAVGQSIDERGRSDILSYGENVRTWASKASVVDDFGGLLVWISANVGLAGMARRDASRYSAPSAAKLRRSQIPGIPPSKSGTSRE